MMDVCPNCHTGALRKRAVSYAAWHTPSGKSGAHFVVVPQVPVWLCDICGAKLFDVEAMTWLTPLLGPTVDTDENGGLTFSQRGYPAPYGAFDGDLDREPA